jgi:hypothetical protein
VKHAHACVAVAACDLLEVRHHLGLANQANGSRAKPLSEYLIRQSEMVVACEMARVLHEFW